MSTSRLVGAAGALTAAGVLAVTFIGSHEGLRLKAYRDVVSVWTICYGWTHGVKPGDVKTKKECDDLLIKSLVEIYEPKMRACLKNKGDDLPKEFYVSLLSFSYNVGSSGACNSKTFKAVNAGDWVGGCHRLMAWVKGGRPKRTIPGLVSRRSDELKLCLEGLKQ